MGYTTGYVCIPSTTQTVRHMENERYEPTKAEFLADLIQGSAIYQSTTASVQRSHRFPLHIFVQIENMARMGDVPVSLIINQLLECGLEAVYSELPEERARELGRLLKEQVERKTVTESVEVKSVRVAKTKLQRSK